MNHLKKIGQIIKRLYRIVSAVFGIILLLLVIVFFNEIRTLLSVKSIEKDVYELTYRGDYALDRYLEDGAEDWDGVLDFINQNLAHGAGKLVYGIQGCSSFYARTPEGDYLLARNLDTDTAIPCVIRTGSKEGYDSLGVTNLMRGGFISSDWLARMTVISSPYYTLDGMNEHGLGIASASVPYGKDVRKEEEVALHDLTVNRVILDKANNVDEAIALLENYYIVMEDHYPSHYMIADASGRCVVVEFDEGDMVVIDMSDDYMISSNFVLRDAGDQPARQCNRYADYDENLSQFKSGITEDEAMSLLKENVIKGQGQWSVVYNLTQRAMIVSFQGHTLVHRYTLND